MSSKINVQLSRGLPKWCKMDKMLISKWEVVLGAPERVNIPCLMHDTRLCQYDVKMTNNLHGTNKIIK